MFISSLISMIVHWGIMKLKQVMFHFCCCHCLCLRHYSDCLWSNMINSELIYHHVFHLFFLLAFYYYTYTCLSLASGHASLFNHCSTTDFNMHVAAVLYTTWSPCEVHFLQQSVWQKVLQNTNTAPTRRFVWTGITPRWSMCS